jgi:hypothetical protein
MDDRDVERARQGLTRCLATLDELRAGVQDADGRRMTTTEWLDIRASTGAALRSLFWAMGDIDDALGVGDTHERLAAYLRAHRDEKVSNYQLMGVAGSLEWARRLRELVADGLEVRRGPGGGLRSGEYRYEGDPD